MRQNASRVYVLERLGAVDALKLLVGPVGPVAQHTVARIAPENFRATMSLSVSTYVYNGRGFVC